MLDEISLSLGFYLRKFKDTITESGVETFHSKKNTVKPSISFPCTIYTSFHITLSNKLSGFNTDYGPMVAPEA